MTQFEGKTILVVDDEEVLRHSLVAYLEDCDFNTLQACNGVEAMELFYSKGPDLVLLDLRMPKMDGLETLGLMLAEKEETPVIIVSGAGTMTDVIETLRLGAWDYLTKPIMDFELLEHAVNKAFERAELLYERKNYQDMLEKKVNERTAQLKEAYGQLQDLLVDTIGAVTKAIEVRDPYTAGHQRRVAELAKAIAKEMTLEPDQVEGVYMGGLIHDIGKISSPAEILANPGKLNEIEYGIVQNHTVVGYEILNEVDFNWPVADIAYQHHERLDGTGYPQGLKGDEICLEARIVAVADVVEAMASHRPYRAALGIDAALDEIKSHRGEFYDAQVVDACLKLFSEKLFSFE